MDLQYIHKLFETYKAATLKHRYINHTHIAPLLHDLKNQSAVGVALDIVGDSVLSKPIYGLKLGSGKKKLLLWSQMHGNESTTTKALFDVINTLTAATQPVSHILEACTLYVIPILNPDGAMNYTRVNANAVDLNRDAQRLSQPESRILKAVFDDFEPHICFNLHGQRTIFAAGHTDSPATVSFLAPAQDADCTITPTRRIAMELIAQMNAVLQQSIPNQVGVYDDTFNINCQGDTFQSTNTPTMLFEAGHFPGDYPREITRKHIYTALMTAMDYLAKHTVDGSQYESYFSIPENKQCFLDIIIRQARLAPQGPVVDVGIMYEERLVAGQIEFVPKVESIGSLASHYAHKTYEAEQNLVVFNHGILPEKGLEIHQISLQEKVMPWLDL